MPAGDRRPSRRPSSSGGSRTRTPEDELRRILLKLFALYPLSGSQDQKLAMEAYRQVLSDVPTLAVSNGVHVLVQEPSRKFVPSVNEIRREAIRWLRRHVRAPYNPNADEEVNDRKVLQAAREQLPQLMPPEVNSLIEGVVKRIGRGGE